MSAEISTARAFIEEAAKRQDAFVQFGLPATFVEVFRAAVAELRQASDVRLSSKTVRRHALAGIETELAQGMDLTRDLDVLVAIATRQDPTTFAAWTTARRVEGQRSTSSSAKRQETAPPVTSPDAAAVAGEPTGAPEVLPPAGPEVSPVQRLPDVLGRAS